LVSSHLLSQQQETAHSEGRDPATNSPDGLGHIPAPIRPPQAWGPLGSSQWAGSPASTALLPACFPLGLFWVVFGFLSGLGCRAAGGGWQAHTACPRTGLLPAGSCSGGVTAPLKRRDNIPQVFLCLCHWLIQTAEGLKYFNSPSDHQKCVFLSCLGDCLVAHLLYLCPEYKHRELTGEQQPEWVSPDRKPRKNHQERSFFWGKQRYRKYTWACYEKRVTGSGEMFRFGA